MTAAAVLSPAHIDLIKAFAAIAVQEGYLTPEPADSSGGDAKCAEQVELHDIERAA